MSSSVGYASRLNQNADVGGTLGEEEIYESNEVVRVKALKVVNLLRAAKEGVNGRFGCVVHTGAGISRACGIPDFRGPDGVWTRKAKGLPPPECDTPLSLAIPSLTHMVIRALVEADFITRVVSCNIDCLHIKSGLNRSKLCELHGNCFAERCEQCGSEKIRDFEMSTVGFKLTRRKCEICGGKLRDQVLDWDDALPCDELQVAQQDSSGAYMSLVLGSSMQIKPSCDIPLKTIRQKRKRNRGDTEHDITGKLVIVNLQPTKKDNKATIVIHTECDKVMKLVAHHLNLVIPDYVRVDKVKVIRSCKPKLAGKGYSFTLRVVNSHDDKAPIPWMTKVVITTQDKSLNPATINKFPGRCTRSVLSGGSLKLVLHFHFASHCTNTMKEDEYMVEFNEEEIATVFECETIRHTYNLDEKL
eukprot:m.300012 g.300012  ORF g.300012 m.300012 type:complete len:416 (+) comp16418_c2_seq3:255-1502(+)